MKTLLAALLFVTSLVRADLVIVQKVEGGGQSGEQTIRIKGDRARIDLAQPVSMITDGAGGMVSLMHAQKSFLKISAAQTKAALERMKKLQPQADPPKLQPTGKKEKIANYECEVFTTSLGGVGVTYWIAGNFPNYQAVLAQMEKLQGGSLSAMGRGMMPELKDFPGMTIKTEMEMGGKKITTLLISAKEEKVDPASFDIPKDYTEASAKIPSFQPK